ncbi:protein FAM151B isoform X1 [Schistocerca cancellata]|uniref:protein FAM151B isoform X1 n=2 Tax=Schistocerca cancellata TaxID=274614 RepID=UPI002117CF2C|nr:protein FAM151B isoform X1 [Schistocerca cancellata]
MARGMAKADVRLWLLLAALPAILSIGGGSTIVTMAQEMKQGPQFEEITKYFEGIADDRTKVTWAHRVNSRQALTKALNDDTLMMLEADVSFGKVNNTGEEMPVMAHAVTDNIDLSLAEFLKVVNETVAPGKVKKGVKLDFKSEMAFNKSRGVIQEARKQMAKPYPLWLNADILVGPVGADKENVNPDVFLNESSILFPSAGLSVGWTTKVSSGDSCYTQEHFKNMLAYLQKYNLNNSDNVTLAVRAIYAGRCSEKLVEWLDSNLKNSTLTLWTGDTDKVDPEPLRNLVTKVSKRRIYVDLPEPLRGQVLNTTTPGSSSSSVGIIISLIVLPITLALCRLQ